MKVNAAIELKMKPIDDIQRLIRVGINAFSHGIYETFEQSNIRSAIIVQFSNSCLWTILLKFVNLS